MLPAAPRISWIFFWILSRNCASEDPTFHLTGMLIGPTCVNQTQRLLTTKVLPSTTMLLNGACTALLVGMEVGRRPERDIFCSEPHASHADDAGAV